MGQRIKAFTWDPRTGKIAPVDFPAQETGARWEDLLDEFLYELREWLYEPANITATLAAVEDVLTRKHHDYGEDNLRVFGELGILVRCSDKVARLQNLIDKQAIVADESHDDTWRDLAGYAVQALIMRKMNAEHHTGENRANAADLFQIRKNRLVRGFCPDCGAGVLVDGGPGSFGDGLRCSQGCGFRVKDFYRACPGLQDIPHVMDEIAARPAAREQK